tara:strand:- start:321 stop:500 length:180 start_codon:yes stop_codon:yes gene_type:complete
MSDKFISVNPDVAKEKIKTAGSKVFKAISTRRQSVANKALDKSIGAAEKGLSRLKSLRK